MSTPTYYESKKKRRNILILILMFILLLILLVSCLAIKHKPINHNETKQVIAGDFLPDIKDAKDMSDEELAKYAQQAADASKFQMLIESDGYISKDDMTGTLHIKNPKSNTYPISVDILDEGNHIIYESGGIEPGQEIKQVQLTKPLKQGKYSMTAVFNIYNPQTLKKQNTQQAIITLHVD